MQTHQVQAPPNSLAAMRAVADDVRTETQAIEQGARARIIAEHTTAEARVLAESPVVTFTDLNAPLLLAVSVARVMETKGGVPALRFIRDAAGAIDGIAVYDASERRAQSEWLFDQSEGGAV